MVSRLVVRSSLSTHSSFNVVSANLDFSWGCENKRYDKYLWNLNWANLQGFNYDRMQHLKLKHAISQYCDSLNNPTIS